MNVERLIARIRGQLELGTPDLEARSLAGEYAALCGRARERLEQCATLIRSGQDHAAFQVAESEPDLLGLCAELSFAESDRWNALCRERGLPAGFPLDSQHVLTLEGLYGKAIGENHPLYRDYRDAIRSRDEDRALSVLRSIVRINPDDPNARSELTRLSAKFLREALGRVGALFAADDEEAAVALMNRMERFGASELVGDPRWDAALARRSTSLRRKAIEQAARLVAEAADARAGEHWEACAAAVSRARALERDHQLALPAGLSERLSSLEDWARGLAAAAEAEASLRAATRDLCDQWAQLQQDSIRGSSPAVLIARLGQWLERAEPLGERLPEGMRQEAEALRDLTRARLSRRYAGLTACWIAGLLCLLGGAYWWHLQEKERQETSELFAEATSKMDGGDHEQAARALDGIVRRRGTGTSGQREQEEKLRTRIAEAREAELKLRGESLYLQARRTEGVTLANLAATHRRAMDYEAALGKVGEATRERLAKVFAEPGELTATCERLIESARAELGARRAELRKQLEGAPTIPDIAAASQALDRIRTLLAVLKPIAGQDLDDAEAEAERAGLRVTAERKTSDTQRALTGAADLKSYLAALAGVAPTNGEKSEAGARAALVLAHAAALRDLPRAALAPRVGAMWDAAGQADPQGVFRPDELPEAELEILRRLGDDPAKGALRRYDVRLTSSQGSGVLRAAFVIGEPTRRTAALNGGKEIVTTAREISREGAITESSWSLRFFDNGVRSGEELTEGAAIPELEYLNNFNRLVDPKTNRTLEPVLRTLDRVRRSPSPFVELRAYQLQELFRAATLRPAAHGIIFSPAAQRDAEQLRRITQNRMGAHDFLFREKWADAQLELKSLFVRQAGATYAEEARFWRAVFGTLRSQNLIFAGMVSGEGRPQLREHVESAVLYGLDAEGRPAALFRIEADGKTERIADAAPLSPLLRLGGNVKEAAQSAGIPNGLTPPAGGWQALLHGRDL